MSRNAQYFFPKVIWTWPIPGTLPYPAETMIGRKPDRFCRLLIHRISPSALKHIMIKQARKPFLLVYLICLNSKLTCYLQVRAVSARNHNPMAQEVSQASVNQIHCENWKNQGYT